ADAFDLISDWCHFAILELAKVRGFRSEPKWIAKKLSLSPLEVNLAVARLVRLGLLSKTEKGEIAATGKGFNTFLQEGFTSAAMKGLQIRFLELAMENIRSPPYELRDNTGMTMAIRRSDLPAVKREIKEFRRRLSAILEAGSGHDEVYQLSVAFFPLTRL